MAPKRPRIPTNRNGIPQLNKIDDFHDLFKSGTKEDIKEHNFADFLEKHSSSKALSQAMMEKGLRAGQIEKRQTHILKKYPAPQQEIDLHGCNGNEARSKTESFIQAARWRGLKTVRIITGKGRHSLGKAVLPDIVENTVREMKKKNLVLSYSWEKKNKLKSGAIVVYLT